MDTYNYFKKEIGLIGEASYEKLKHTLVFIFGLGGVGSFAFEALVRAGVGNFIIVDKDSFDESNINRQLMALTDTVGKDKVVVYHNRAKSINENVNVVGMKLDINSHVADIYNMINDFDKIDKIFALDMIDDINAKCEIISFFKSKNIDIISSMGTANHISTDNMKITDIEKTKYCPVAKIMRKKMKELSIDRLDVLYIDEEQIDTDSLSTISYVPSIAGLKIAEYVIRKII